MATIFRRGGTWYSKFRLHGREIRKPLAATAGEARRKLAELQAAAGRGELVGRVSLRTALDEYFSAPDVCGHRPKTVEADTRARTHLEAFFIGRAADADAITVDLVAQYRKRRLAGGASHRTLNMETGLLKRVLGQAVEQRRLRVNPAASLKPLPSKPVREHRYVSDEEIRRILGVAKSPFKELFLALITTGARVGEVVSLQWRDVDLVGGAFHLGERLDAPTKTGRPRTVALCTTLLDVLRGWFRSRSPKLSDTVFLNGKGRPFTVRNVLARLKATLPRAGVDPKGVNVHTLRGTWASHALRAGVPVKAVQSVLGHRTPHLTLALYSRIAQEDEKQAVAVTTAKILGEAGTKTGTAGAPAAS